MSERSRGRIVVIRDWNSSQVGHGGQRRSAQIEELLRELDININLQFWLTSRGSYRTWPTPNRLFNIVRKSGLKVYRMYDLFRMLPYVDVVSRIAREIREGDIVIVESTRGYLLPRIVSEKRARVIVAPHNIESFAGYYPPLCSLDRARSLSREAYFLKSHRCITISDVDQAILYSLGVESHLWKYAPTKEQKRHLAGIRAKRDRSKQELVTLIGTATNPPTVRGMQEFIDEFIHLPIPKRLVVAGFGTHVLNVRDPSRVDLLGTVSEEQLADLLLRTKASIVYQTSGSGQLTRVAENLFAGVPTVGNTFALRGYAHLKGVYACGSIREMVEQCKENDIEEACPKLYEEHVDRQRRGVEGIVKNLTLSVLDRACMPYSSHSFNERTRASAK